MEFFSHARSSTFPPHSLYSSIRCYRDSVFSCPTSLPFLVVLLAHSPWLLRLTTFLFLSLSSASCNLQLEAFLVCLLLLLFSASSFNYQKCFHLSLSLSATSICSLSVCSGPTSSHFHCFPACFLTSLPLWKGTCKTVCSYFFTCLQGNTGQFSSSVTHTSTQTKTNTHTFYLLCRQTLKWLLEGETFLSGCECGPAKDRREMVRDGDSRLEQVGSCVWNDTNTRLVHLQGLMGRDNPSIDLVVCLETCSRIRKEAEMDRYRLWMKEQSVKPCRLLFVCVCV